MKKNNAPNNILQQLMPLVDGIAETFGEHCEVVLHDLSNPSKSIIKVANGHITGRDVGVPLTDLGLLLYEKVKDDKDSNLFVGYRTRTKKGLELKSTTLFIRNSRGKIIGSLCINIDITSYLSARNILDSICEIRDYTFESGDNVSPEKFHQNLDTLIHDLLEGSINKIGKPISYMDKEDKIRIVRDLKEKGFFLIKGSLKKLSSAIGVSLPTIYKYLEEA